MSRTPLPIDRVLPDIVASAHQRGRRVLHAPPGTGKTTRVPAALIDSGLVGQVLILEPRRLAARAAARRVATERGGRVGEEVGYHVRHDRRFSKQTRIRFLTEGILLRQLVVDPFLDGVGAVVLDEFHERHMEGDLCLAMLREICLTVRPDLRLIVMSATLDSAPLCTFLDAAEVRVDGNLFPVHTIHEKVADRRPLESRVKDLVQKALQDTPGDVLVFLPGMREIRSCEGAMAGLARQDDLMVLPLHGQLEPDDQDRAVLPAARRKVVLATNIAESSLTIDGVTAVIDTGLARVLRHDPATGLDVLRVERISLASADQRRGRAGRTSQGMCYRMWALGEERGMAAFDTPEVRRIDIAGPALAVRAFAGPDPASFRWFESPEPAALASAGDLLRLLGAVDASGRVTITGREMLELPLHPRLGRMVLEGRSRGCARSAATLAALLSERDVLKRDATPGKAGSGLFERMEWFDQADASGGDANTCRSLGLDPAAFRSVLRARDQIASRDQDEVAPTEADLAAVVLAGFPDRVARRMAASSEATMVGGRPLRLLPGSVPQDTELLVVVRVQEAADRSGRANVALAVPVDRALLQSIVPEAFTVEAGLELDETRGRVLAVRRTRYLDLVLVESRGGELEPEAAARALHSLLLRDPWRYLGEQKTLRRLLARVRWLRQQAPDLDLPDVDDVAIVEASMAALSGGTNLTALSQVDLAPWLERNVPQLRAVLDAEAPDRLRLPSGRMAAIEYDAEGGPAVRGRLQEFFGLRTPPRIARGRIALVLHLLAPNGRPEQITKDLDSFWANVYPRVRNELMRRYPRHAWPLDPLAAEPEARPKKRPR